MNNQARRSRRQTWLVLVCFGSALFATATMLLGKISARGALIIAGALLLARNRASRHALACGLPRS